MVSTWYPSTPSLRGAHSCSLSRLVAHWKLRRPPRGAPCAHPGVPTPWRLRLFPVRDPRPSSLACACADVRGKGTMATAAGFLKNLSTTLVDDASGGRIESIRSRLEMELLRGGLDKKADVQVYGSSGSGLAAPSSDVDLSVYAPRLHRRFLREQAEFRSQHEAILGQLHRLGALHGSRLDAVKVASRIQNLERELALSIAKLDNVSEGRKRTKRTSIGRRQRRVEETVLAELVPLGYTKDEAAALLDDESLRNALADDKRLTKALRTLRRSWENRKARDIRIVASLLQRGGTFAVEQVVPFARVPIVKTVYRSSPGGVPVHCDICIGNRLAVQNTALLRTLSSISQPLKAFLVLVKNWAKTKGICDASMGTLSSYAHMIVALSFLRHGCSPPRIPNLLPLRAPSSPDEGGRSGSDSAASAVPQGVTGVHTPDNLRIMVDGIDATFLSVPDADADYAQVQWEDVPGLLAEYFAFLDAFDRVTQCISMRGIFPRPERFSQHALCIEDPFETFSSDRPHDLGGTLSAANVDLVFGEIRAGAHLLKSDSSAEAYRKLFQERNTRRGAQGQAVVDCADLETMLLDEATLERGVPLTKKSSPPKSSADIHISPETLAMVTPLAVEVLPESGEMRLKAFRNALAAALTNANASADLLKQVNPENASPNAWVRALVEQIPDSIEVSARGMIRRAQTQRTVSGPEQVSLSTLLPEQDESGEVLRSALDCAKGLLLARRRMKMTEFRLEMEELMREAGAPDSTLSRIDPRESTAPNTWCKSILRNFPDGYVKLAGGSVYLTKAGARAMDADAQGAVVSQGDPLPRKADLESKGVDLECLRSVLVALVEQSRGNFGWIKVTKLRETLHENIERTGNTCGFGRIALQHFPGPVRNAQDLQPGPNVFLKHMLRIFADTFEMSGGKVRLATVPGLSGRHDGGSIRKEATTAKEETTEAKTQASVVPVGQTLSEIEVECREDVDAGGTGSDGTEMLGLVSSFFRKMQVEDGEE